MRHLLMTALLLGLAISFNACDEDNADDTSADTDSDTDSDSDSDTDTDTDTDTDGDTDTDTDSDSDTDTDSDGDTDDGECPLNSAYPCTCEATSKTCEDGNPCIIPEGYTNFGICALPCNGMAENALCQAQADGWGASAACMFAEGGVIGQGMGQNCGILCLWKGVTGDCPPIQECLPTIMPGADICLPIE